MDNKPSTALIKFSKSEIEIIINSLHMTTTTIIPTEENGQWKKPYEAILKDLIDIKKSLLEKERQYAISGEKETESYNQETCETCN